MIVSYVARFWSALMGLAFIPVYSRLMGIEAMGVVGLFVTLQAVCMLLDAGLSTTLNREIARMSVAPGEEQTMRDLVRTLEPLYWGASLLGCLGVVLLAPFIAHGWVQVETLRPSEVAGAIRLMGVVMLFQLPYSFYGGGLLGLQRQIEFGLLSAGWYTLRFGGSVVALLVFPPTLRTFFLWQVAVAALAAVWGMMLLWRLLPAAPKRARLDWGLLAGRWRFAAGLGAVSATLLVLNNTDTAVLTKLVPLEQFGYYTLAWMLPNALRQLAEPVNLVFFPKLSQAWAADDPVALIRLYHRVCGIMAVATIPLGLSLALFAPEALLVWVRNPETVARVAPAMRFLAVGNLLLTQNVVPYSLQLASGWTGLTLWSNVVAALVSIPLMWVLALHFGVIGGGITWVVLNGGYLAITVALMHRRLLVGQGARWLFKDLLRIVVPVLGVLLLLRLAIPAPRSVFGALLAFGGVFAASQAVAVAVSPWGNGFVGRLGRLLRRQGA